MEGVFEEESQLRRCVENELLSDTSISPEQALKVSRKIPYTIYLWWRYLRELF